jgi:Zn-finger nucleic acid-binding protein
MKEYVCPQCAIAMRAVQVVSHYEKPFEVEQCSKCGGMWFDAYEHYRVADQDVARLDLLDEKQLVATVSIKKVLQCPKDQTTLRVFRDAQFPSDMIIESCHTCGGFWFNRGELQKYRSFFLKKWPRKHSVQAPASLLTKHFLQTNSAHEQKVREREALKAFSKESLLSLVTFLVFHPAGLVQKAMLRAGPFWALFEKLLGVRADTRVHVDMREFQSLIEEAQKKERKGV